MYSTKKYKMQFLNNRGKHLYFRDGPLLKKLSVTMSIALYPRQRPPHPPLWASDRGQPTLPYLPGLISLLITGIEMLL